MFDFKASAWIRLRMRWWFIHEQPMLEFLLVGTLASIPVAPGWVGVQGI